MVPLVTQDTDLIYNVDTKRHGKCLSVFYTPARGVCWVNVKSCLEMMKPLATFDVLYINPQMPWVPTSLTLSLIRKLLDGSAAKMFLSALESVAEMSDHYDYMIGTIMLAYYERMIHPLFADELKESPEELDKIYFSEMSYRTYIGTELALSEMEAAKTVPWNKPVFSFPFCVFEKYGVPEYKGWERDAAHCFNFETQLDHQISCVST